MRIMITGSNGLLGQKIADLFARSKNYNFLNTSIEDKSFLTNNKLNYRTLDITNRNSVLKLVDEFLPDVIINTAALTNVDLCETERATAWKLNVTAVENLVFAAKMVGAKIIHFSTDYVFDGKSGPYSELDRPNPLSYYGRTKLASENLLRTAEIPHVIIRTMVLFGIANNVKDNFAVWLVKNLGQGRSVKVVEDQICNPTLVDDLAYSVLKIVEFKKEGLFHIAGKDLVSRYDFALALAKKFKSDKKLIIPIKTQILKQPAPRPMKSGFIILKAETGLNLKMSGVEQGLTVFYNQYMNSKNDCYKKGIII